MSKIVSKILFTYFLPLGVLISAHLFFNYISVQRVEVVYDLSGPIHSRSIDDALVSNLYKLKILNIGIVKADKIVVKMDEKIYDCEVVKHSPGGSYIKDDKGEFQIEYEYLPPDTEFEVIFKSQNDNITNNNVTVYHNIGKGKSLIQNTKDAETRSRKANSTLSIVMSVIVLAHLLRIERIRSYELRFVCDFPKEFEMKKPFYMLKVEWRSVCSMCMIKYMALMIQEIVPDVKSMQAYYVLDKKINLNKDYVKEEDLFSYAEQILTTKIRSSSLIFNLKDFKKIFELKKPERIYQATWDELLDEIEKIYVSRLIFEDQIYYGLDYKKKERPDFIKEKNFQTYLIVADSLELFNKDVIKVKLDREKAEKYLNILLRQLDYIDKIINNPNFIDRIESIDDTFTPTNMRNLKRLSKMLNKNSI